MLNFPDPSLQQGQPCRFQPPSVNVDLSFVVICQPPSDGLLTFSDS